MFREAGWSDRCATQLLHKLTQILENSAHGLFRIGRYQQCILEETMKYSMLYLGANSTSPVVAQMGLCLPSACSDL